MTDGISIVKIEGADELRAKLKNLGPAMRKVLKDANQKNADEFKATVARIIPREHGDLAATLDSWPAGQWGAGVSVGNAKVPYPLHLEAGHRNADGSITPGKPFWNPAKRVQRKRWHNRTSRAMRQVVKAVAAGGG